MENLRQFPPHSKHRLFRVGQIQLLRTNWKDSTVSFHSYSSGWYTIASETNITV